MFFCVCVCVMELVSNLLGDFMFVVVCGYGGVYVFLFVGMMILGFCIGSELRAGKDVLRGGAVFVFE